MWFNVGHLDKYTWVPVFLVSYMPGKVIQGLSSYLEVVSTSHHLLKNKRRKKTFTFAIISLTALNKKCLWRMSEYCWSMKLMPPCIFLSVSFFYPQQCPCSCSVPRFFSPLITDKANDNCLTQLLNTPRSPFIMFVWQHWFSTNFANERRIHL